MNPKDVTQGLQIQKDFSFPDKQVLWVEGDPQTEIEREFANQLKRALVQRSVTIKEETDFRQYLTCSEKVKTWLTFLGINVSLLGQRIYNFGTWGVNELFQTSLQCYPDYLKFPVLYPLSSKKYLVPSHTPILYIGKLPHDHCTRLFKIRQVVMLQEIPDEDLTNTDSAFQHNYSMDNGLTRGCTNWFGISKQRNFRIYSINGCSRVYRWDEMDNVFTDILCKFFLRPTVPRPGDFITEYQSFGNILPPYITDYFATVSDILTQKGLLPIKRKIGYMGCNIKSLMAKKFLEDRSGMSYGFLAYQLPIRPGHVEEIKAVNGITALSHCDARSNGMCVPNNNYGFHGSKFYIRVPKDPQTGGESQDRVLLVTLPELYVVTTRSGCDKSNIDPDKDLLLYRVREGAVTQIIPYNGMNFHPSFDIWIILVQTLCNGLITSVLNYLNPKNSYCNDVMQNGMMMVHVHAFPDRKRLENGMMWFGENNPAVCCGCQAGCAFCFRDQMAKFSANLTQHIKTYTGSLFLEKDHGIVMSTNYRKDQAQLKELFDSYIYGEKNYETFL
jgi:hypothetical protein